MISMVLSKKQLLITVSDNIRCCYNTNIINAEIFLSPSCAGRFEFSLRKLSISREILELFGKIGGHYGNNNCDRLRANNTHA